jgi:hypothetical protein
VRQKPSDDDAEPLNGATIVLRPKLKKRRSLFRLAVADVVGGGTKEEAAPSFSFDDHDDADGRVEML